MGILSHLFCIDINRGVRNYQATPGAVLLDVRSRESYARKRIPESRNLPLEELSRAKEVLLHQLIFLLNNLSRLFLRLYLLNLF